MAALSMTWHCSCGRATWTWRRWSATACSRSTLSSERYSKSGSSSTNSVTLTETTKGGCSCSSHSNGFGGGSLPEGFGGRERWSRIHPLHAFERSKVHWGVVESETAVEQHAEPDQAHGTLWVTRLAIITWNALRRYARALITISTGKAQLLIQLQNHIWR